MGIIVLAKSLMFKTSSTNASSEGKKEKDRKIINMGSLRRFMQDQQICSIVVIFSFKCFKLTLSLLVREFTLHLEIYLYIFNRRNKNNQTEGNP